MAGSNDNPLVRAYSRRGFLGSSALALGAAALTGPLPFMSTRALARGIIELPGTRGPSPYGPLVPTRDHATGLELIMLPRGFQYTTFSWRGDTLSDGHTVQSGHDGMAVVAATRRGPRGPYRGFTLIRNHEVFGVGGSPIRPTNNYDSIASGGTTVLEWQDGRLRSSHVSISGTSSNCAGGPTPWGSWCTCEETVDVGNQPHGYVFESTVLPVLDPTPLTAMGRFAHEAVAFDPRTGNAFLTEDDSSSIPGDPSPRTRGNSGFYCFVPANPLGGECSLEAGGTLYMLQARDGFGSPVNDLRNPQFGDTFATEWIEIEDPNAAPVGSVSGPYTEGRAKGATRFQRLEGCWWDPMRQAITFNDTEGGPVGAQSGSDDRAEGAVWRYDPSAGTLTCIFVSRGAFAPDAYGADNPDNVTVSPNGGILLCEDGGTDDGNGLSLLGLLENGQTFEFARNIINITNGDADALVRAGHDPGAFAADDYSGQEWAGATFAPDGNTLFVNIQTPGITFAITGPFQRGPF